MYNRIRNPMNRMRSLLLVALLVSAAFLCGFQSRSTQEPATQKLADSSATTTENSGKGQFDGPAELPRSTVDVRMPQQTKKVVAVRANDNLQAALEKASCGDTIQLESGATF